MAIHTFGGKINTMIQRIQTIYLLLAAAALACPLFFPLASASGDAIALAALGDNFFADGQYWAKELPGGLGVLFLGAVSLFCIFLYKNRPRQMQVVASLSLMTALFSVLFGVLGYFNAEKLPPGAGLKFELGGVFPVLSILFFVLARRAIKKDEELVRSSDRLR